MKMNKHKLKKRIRTLVPLAFSGDRKDDTARRHSRNEKKCRRAKA